MLSLDSHYKPLYVYAEPRTRHAEFTYQHRGKRVFDVCFSLLVVILILSWLIPLLGILIKLDSPGPVLFVQKRTGYRGNWFYCFKFRTMKHKPNAAFKQATKQDNRVTRLGRFLRKTNLDEMPQFLNVLIGDMSVVGPRPHALQHSAQFWNSMPDYRKRYRVKPGITGLAQVRGCRGETEKLMKMQHRIKYDRFYRKKINIFIDIWICWLTVKNMISDNVNAF
ncbi:sugar transferase [Spirosoma soli]|uniref:Sugar transferase n=1 Tax=Spirosoma soli TaxID=1770529 RepID=A0ABW5M152_9BACT